ncbi:unnamed protein product [Tilletia controversa]|uniref:Uncharacterized protein n=2 Tax=Tilletia TaxID=13289 RepID=A0A9N8QID5_9BASI|nr:hypothetical protein CF336_g2563 [Tilletia laevis]CAD6891751.1 unnamed protein product [Tilletia caries]CAD6898393.1 unnamed protein product [Tilletia controversa]KAE8206613.1 hypothetical protein CF335_g1753 [Tilletia laevis]CAD6908417.1 unnamed protein product [Tilletia controversa]
MASSAPATPSLRDKGFAPSMLIFPVTDTLFQLFGKLVPFLLPNPPVPMPSESDTIRDVSGKTCVVTGANSGIGLAITKELILRGAIVTMACRSSTRAEKARNELLTQLEKESPSTKDAASRLLIASLDTSSFANVRDFAKSYTGTQGQDGQKIDLLFLNAGIGAPTIHEELLTEDGFELTYKPDAYHDSTAYSHTKAMQIVLSRALNEKAAITGSRRITLAFHPGLVSTNFFQTADQLRSMTIIQFAKQLQRFVGLLPEESARTPVFLATAAESALGKRERWSKIWSRCMPYTTPIDLFNPERFWQRWCADAEIPTDWSI